MLLLGALAIAFVCTKPVSAQGTSGARPDLQWFKDAKLGIFIHWGIYSVNGTDESWAFYNKKMPYADYMKQLDRLHGEEL